jgi:predicted MPP superfamily phosphohydrolase
MVPSWIEVTRPEVAVEGLPPAFAGLRIAVLTDIHHGPFLSRQRLERIVRVTNAQHPDLTLILGDIAHRGARRIAPAWEELGRLHAPLGVYGVLGNHDVWEGADATREAMARAGIADMTERAEPLVRGEERLYLVGLGDLWAEPSDLARAMSGVGEGDVALVMTHNPDAFELQHDPRAKLWMAGHTHGGQVVMPWLFRPYVSSRYGQKYRAGLVHREGSQIYISRGLGCVTPPVRVNCRPELPVIELRPPGASDKRPIAR